MSLLHFTKSFSLITSSLGLLTISNTILISSANAFSVTFSNGGFEQSIINSQNSWNTIGDVTISPEIDGVAPTNGSNQAIVTTGYRANTEPDGTLRNDDNGLIFNQSFNEPVSADTNSSTALQNHFGFDPNALSINRSDGATFPGPRTSKEGSGLYQDFEVTLDAGETSFTVAFDWAFLTNDGTTQLGGDQDFAFWSLGQINNGNYTTAFSGTSNPNDEIMVLISSDTDANFIENIDPPTTANDYLYESDYAANSREFYTVTGLTPGQTYNYRLGYGVVDVDGLGRTSTLLIDNVEAIPFEFSPAFGLTFVASIFGLTCLRRKLQSDAEAQ